MPTKYEVQRGNMKAHKQAQITNSEIAHIQTLREMTKVLKSRLEKLENDLEANE